MRGRCPTTARWELASLFGAAIATRSERADVVAFQSTSTKVKLKKGGSVLRAIESFRPLVGGGTETFRALRDHFKDHDRVVVLTDEQAFYDAGRGIVPAEDVAAPIYTFNLAGYAAGHLPSGGHRRYTFGGLSDRAFAAIELLERGRDLSWDDLFAIAPRSPTTGDSSEAADARFGDGDEA